MFVLVNCDNDFATDNPQLETLSTTKSPYRTEMVSIKQIPDIVNFLNAKSKKNLFLNQPTNKVIGGAIFDTDNVLKVMDSLNHSNYSFNFVFPTTPKNVFYNLIVGVTSSGVKQEPYIIKYVVNDSHLDGFIQSGFNLSTFSGTIALHPFNDFFNKSDFSNRDCTVFDQYGDPIPCQQITVNSGSYSGGGTLTSNDLGSGNSLTGISPSLGGGGSTIGSWDITCSCENHSASVILSGNCDCLKIGGYYIISFFRTASSTNGRTSSTDCPPCVILSEGGVGVNITKCPPGYVNDGNNNCVPKPCEDPSMVYDLNSNVCVDALAYQLGLETNSEAYNWLVYHATDEQYSQIGQFLEKNKLTVETKEFINLLISFWILME